MSVKRGAIAYEKGPFDVFIPICFSTLAFWGVIISVTLFGFSILSVDQTAKCVLAMFFVFVADQLLVKRRLKWAR